MALEDELLEATLRRLELEPVEFAEETIEVVATVLVPGPSEDTFEGPMRESLAEQLRGEARKVIREKAAGRVAVGVVKSKCGYSDDARGRTYSIVLRVAVT